MEIDIRAKSLSKDQATAILQSIYEIYFGRSIDPTGEKSWTPIVERYGFQGLAFVVYQMLQSTKMNERVQKELSRVYRENLGREVDPVGRQAYDPPLRFFRGRGQEEVIKSIRKSPEYTKRRIELKPQEDIAEAISLKIKQGNISSETYAEFAKANAEIHRYEAAVDAYTQAITLAEEPTYYVERGKIRFKLEEYPQAIDDFRAALSKGYQPQGDTHFWIAQTLEMLGDLEQSAQEYEAATASNPHDLALVWYQLGIVQQKLGNVEKGIESFTIALDAQPNPDLEPRIFVERGRAYVRLGKTDEASDDFAKFVGRSRTWKRLIQANMPTIYLVRDGTKYPIPDPPTLNYIALEEELQLLERVSTIELKAYPEGKAIPSVLSLRVVQRSKNKGEAAFLVDRGRRRWIPNADTFITLGLDLGKIETPIQDELARIPLGLPILLRAGLIGGAQPE